jgi:hypothetical protein
MANTFNAVAATGASYTNETGAERLIRILRERKRQQQGLPPRR